jgi:glutamate dehydrogenase (NAD(P)+)
VAQASGPYRKLSAVSGTGPPPEPYLRVRWKDPITGADGYAVIDRLVHEFAGGGIRMRLGLTMEEVERLARTMTLKKGAAMTPGGGAKGGIDFDPRHPQAEAVLRRYLEAMSPLLTTCWATAEDLGVSQELLNRLFAELGLGMSIQPTLDRSGDPEAGARRMKDSMAIDVEGVPLGDCVGGFGVAAAAAAAIRHLGLEAGSRAVVQGFGSIGGSAARYLARAGQRVVAVADGSGLVHAPGGVDVEALLAARSVHGDIDRGRLPAGHQQLPGELWLDLEADVLVPAAVSDVIDEGNCVRVGAALIVEGANIPITETARRLLHDRGVALVPDFVANAGTMAWFNWTAMGQLEADAGQAFARVRELMDRNVPAVFRLAEELGVTPHEAAVVLAERNVAEMLKRYGGAAPGRLALGRVRG